LGRVAAQQAADTEANKELVRSVYDAFNARDTAAVEALLADTFVDRMPAMGQAAGGAGFAQGYGLYNPGLPDLQVEIENMVAEGNEVSARLTGRGTHQGPVFGVPPSGAPVIYEAISLWRIADGKLAEVWHVEDNLSLAIQVGAIPALPGPSGTPMSGTSAEPVGETHTAATPSGPVDEEANKEIARRVYEEAFSGDVDSLNELVADDYFKHTFDPGIAPGREGFRQSLMATLTGFPDLSCTSDDVIAEGDTVVIRVTCNGTHEGVFAGLQPTGKHVTVVGIDEMRIVDEQVVEHWNFLDRFGLLAQIFPMGGGQGGAQASPVA